MRFGEFLKKIREENDITQKELAEKSGVSSAELSRIETGNRKKVSPNVIKAIYPYLGVSYETMLSRAGYLDTGSINYEKFIGQEVEHKPEIDNNTENILSLLASYLFLNKWNVERSDAFFNQEQRSILQSMNMAETLYRNLSDVVARKDSEEWHISVKDFQIGKYQPPKWSQEETDIICNVIFKAYGMIATYNYSPITKFSIATSNIDYFNVMKEISPVHLDLIVSILLTDLEKNKVIEEHVFE